MQRPQNQNIPGGGTHMLWYAGMCCLNGLLFHPKILRYESHFGQKILSRGSHFTKIEKKIGKSAVLEVEKSLEMGPDLQKFQKTVKSAVFLQRKILRYG